MSSYSFFLFICCYGVVYYLIFKCRPTFHAWDKKTQLQHVSSFVYYWICFAIIFLRDSCNFMLSLVFCSSRVFSFFYEWKREHIYFKNKVIESILFMNLVYLPCSTFFFFFLWWAWGQERSGGGGSCPDVMCLYLQDSPRNLTEKQYLIV